MSYITNLLGHEGPGSLLSFLRKKDLADQLVAAYSEEGVSFLKIAMTLTQSGLEKVDDVVCHFFRFVNLLKTTGQHDRFWEEMELINDIRTRHTEMYYTLTHISSLATKLIVSN